jgi:4-diphosphocytidyl-2-C-methyl-D-erythritol kinase
VAAAAGREAGPLCRRQGRRAAQPRAGRQGRSAEGDCSALTPLCRFPPRPDLTRLAPPPPRPDPGPAPQALNLFRAKTGSTSHFRVRLDKRVPHGAGLGGGSGNAATTLWAANELAGRPASDGDLLKWSGDIGSDISVFFSRGAAYCTGRGEVVEDVAPPLPLDTRLLLVKPPIGLSTPAIFKALDLGRRSAAEPRGLLEGLAAAGRLSDALCVNDLEQPAFDTLPDLAALKAKLAAAAGAGGRPFDAVFMTGSGSTIVCAGSDAAPGFLSGPEYKEVFVSPARLIVRRPGEWYAAPAGGPRAAAAAAAAATAAA